MPNQSPKQHPIRFSSAGADLAGQIYLGAGDGPRPTCIFLHGMPGIEKNLDVAEALSERGWNAVIWSPRGAGGSGGDYTIAGAVDDLAELVRLLRADQWPIDWNRIALLGYSLGGAQVVQFAYRDADLAAAPVLIAPVADFLEMSISAEFAQRCSADLNGITADALQRSWMQQAWEHNPVDLIAELSQSLLVVRGGADEDVPGYVVESLVEAAQEVVYHIIPDADHAFHGHRPALIEAIASWLETTLGV